MAVHQRHTQIPVFGLPPEQRERVTIAALAIGVLATAILVAATPINDMLLNGTKIAGNHFPIGAFAVLLILVLVVNVVLRKLAPRLALSPAQLIAVWALVAVPSGIPAAGMMRYFVPHLVAYHYYASPENKWDELFGDQIPSSLLVEDEMAVKTFFEGLPPGMSIPWQAWLRPTAVWGIYACALYAMMIGLSVMLRRRWVEHERFTFPLVQVPLEVANSPEPGHLLNSFLRNRQVWLAVSVLVVIHSLNGLHRFCPGIPTVRMGWGFSSQEPPWSYGGTWFMLVFPLMIGFAYLLASEVCFSLWFFYVFGKLRAIIIGLLGLPLAGVGPMGYARFLWGSLEEAGGTVALALWFIWLARDHFLRVLRKGITGDPAIDDSDEPLSYRATTLLFVIGAAVMVIWLGYFGGSLVLAAANVIMGIAVFVTLAWMVSQAGLIFLQPTFSTSEIVANLTGSRHWTTHSLLVNMWNEQVFRMDLREYLLPSLLNAHKISDPVNLHRGSLLKSCIAALGLAFFVSLVSALRLPYAHGGAVSIPDRWAYQMSSQLPFRWVAGLAVTPLDFNPRWVGHFAGGFLLMLTLMRLRTGISWFALHPIGFIIGTGYPLEAMWFSIFVGWLVKAAIVRWGGYKAYQGIRPFFLGLIIGDCLAGAIWIVVGLITKTGHPILPG